MTSSYHHHNKDEESLWLGILSNWGALEQSKPGYIHYVIHKQGIADVYRGQAWKALSRSCTQRQQHPEVYQRLLKSKNVNQEDIIERDIKRTFSKHRFFEEPCGQGQSDLFQVLRAYAAYDHEVGYCQGMGFVTAILLCYLSPQDAFWVLVSLMQRPEYAMRGLFRPGLPRFPKLLQQFQNNVEHQLPKLHHHFARIGLDASMYASQWFMALFSYNFPMRFVVRLWDIFFVDGWSIIFRVAIAILAQVESELLKMDFEKAMLYFRDLPKHMQVELIVARALTVELCDIPT